MLLEYFVRFYGFDNYVRLQDNIRVCSDSVTIINRYDNL